MTEAPIKKRSPRRRVLVAYCTLLLVGLAFGLGGLSYPFTLEDGLIGPAALPVVSGLLLVFVSVLLIVQEVRGGSILEGDGVVSEEHEDPAERAAVRKKLITVVGSTVIAVALLPLLGLLPALTLLVIFHTAVVERQRWWKALASAVGAFVVSYLIFIVILGTPLPFGLFNPALWGIQ